MTTTAEKSVEKAPKAASKPKLQFLLHHPGDGVGVAVVDIKAGETVRGRALSETNLTELQALMDIPLGHKIALREFKPGDTVMKYGCDIGKTVAAIKKGEHVHVHNLKTKRW